jgi:predicted RNA binding protein YcfA (HicA-like mRNA interferase family)
MPDPSIMGTEERACRALFDPIRRVSEGRMMEYYMKIREVVALLEADGWQLVQTGGSHRQYRHARKPGRVTVAGNLNDDLAPGTLNSVLKQAGLKKR